MSDNKINCEICRDLLPLVKDGVASADSEAAVREHIRECRECARIFDGECIPKEPPVSSKALLKMKRRLFGIYLALMLLGIYFGLTINSSDMFYNCLIMPIAGVFGYLAFGAHSLYIVPAALTVVSLIVNALGYFSFGVEERANILEVLSWVMIYALFAVAGIIIAMLLHFAFGKKEGSGNDEN